MHPYRSLYTRTDQRRATRRILKLSLGVSDLESFKLYPSKLRFFSFFSPETVLINDLTD